jgi:hypothetical protein
MAQSAEALLLRRNDYDGWQRTTHTPQTGDQVRPPAEEDGEDPDRVEDREEENETAVGRMSARK